MTYLILFLLGVLLDRYILPSLDVLLEVYSHRASEKATQYQLNAQTLVAEFKRKYPEVEAVDDGNLIGFQVETVDEEDFDDLEEEDLVKENRMGFIK